MFVVDNYRERKTFPSHPSPLFILIKGKRFHCVLGVADFEGLHQLSRSLMVTVLTFVVPSKKRRKAVKYTQGLLSSYHIELRPRRGRFGEWNRGILSLPATTNVVISRRMKLPRLSRRQWATAIVVALADFATAICVSLQAPFYPAEVRI